ncbi:hypothetical protein, partial [Burkholderia sp. Ap-962]|uniref:hypothetical protein n=1 Tax=Burkholderia sp. Ap-962 TaxID=2608333 RepID=UPI0014203CEF
MLLPFVLLRMRCRVLLGLMLRMLGRPRLRSRARRLVLLRRRMHLMLLLEGLARLGRRLALLAGRLGRL